MTTINYSDQLNSLRSFDFLEIPVNSKIEETEIVYFNKHLNLKINFMINLTIMKENINIVNLTHISGKQENLDSYKKFMSEFNSNYSFNNLTEYFKK